MRFRAIAVVAALCVVAVAGCGGGSGGKKSATTTAATTPAGAASVSEAAKNARQILADSTAAISRVHSFHLQGSENDVSGRALINGDIVLPGRVRLALRQGASQVVLIVVGSDAYIRANRAFWKTLKSAAKLAPLLADKWVKVPALSTPGFAQFTALSNPATIGRCLLNTHLGAISKAGTATVAGRRAVVLIDKGNVPGGSPGRLYVAATGPPLPLRAVQTGRTRPGGTPDATCHETKDTSTSKSSSLTLGRYNTPVTIVPPAGAIDLSQLGGAKA